jgi:type II secretory pathway component GspD/PulD (secretin)
MKACLSFASAIAVLLVACSPGGPSLDTRTFALKYLRGPDAIPIVAPYVYADRPNAKGVFTVSDNAISVRETPDNLDKIARVLAQYDRPRPFIRLTFHLIEADGAATSDSAIRDVEATLRQLFRFRGYRVVGQGVVSATEKAEVSQMLAAEPEHYALTTTVMRLAGAADSATVELGVELVGRGGRFRTTVTIPVGKTAVLGNVQASSKGRTLILTVRPEVLTASP